MSGDDESTRGDKPTRWDRETADASPAVTLSRATAFDGEGERFAIGDELGRGGMGRVVAATDTALDRPVAIKLALGDETENLARFEREVRITAQLEHPAIVPVHDAGRDAQGRPYYIMRRIAGEPLSKRVEAASVRERLALVPNVLAAVDAAAFAHARGVIHRDIKPWNILIGPYGETLLIDWGLARRLDEDDLPGGTTSGGEALTRLGHAYGTPGYMAPEQARGERGDQRADVYALGATLFHVLAAKTPFDGTTADDWLARAATNPIPMPVAKLPDEVPRELVTIIAKATASDPAARYADAGALAADLRAFLAGQLVAAHRYTTVERLRRFVRRHRIAVATAAIALVALVVIGSLAIASVVRERDAAAAAREVAADRAEMLLLDRASTLAPRDPTRAVALLRELPARSPHVARARDIAAVAAAHGITHGVAAHRGAVRALALSPDGTQLASGGADGALVVHDLATRRARTLVEGRGNITQIEWVDGAVLYLTPTKLERVALAGGAPSVIAEGVQWLWKVSDTRVRYVRANELVQQDLGGEPTLLASGVMRAIGTGEVAVVLGATDVRVVDASGVRTLATLAARDFVSTLAISEDGARLAAGTGEHVIEWDRATATERRRWPGRTSNLMYAGTQLYAQLVGAGGLDELTDLGPRPVVRGTFAQLHAARSATGVVAVGNDGVMAVLVDGRALRYDHDPLPIRALATTPRSAIVAAGLVDGSLRWWDTRAFVPRTVAIPKGAAMCAADATHLYVLDAGALFAIAYDGGPPRRLGSGEYSDCRPRVGPWLVATPAVGGRSALVDVTTGAETRFPDVVTVDTHAGSVVIVENGRDIVEVTGDGTRRPRTTAPAPITHLTAHGGWIVAALADKRILRIDRRGTSTVSKPTTFTAIAITSTGIVWTIEEGEVRRWDGAEKRTIGPLPGEATVLAALADDTALVVQRDATIWHATARGLVQRAGAASGERRIERGARVAAAVEGGSNVELFYVDTGVRVVRRAPELVHIAAVGASDRLLVIQTASSHAMIFDDAGPLDPAALHAWIDGATNATVARDSDALTWR